MVQTLQRVEDLVKIILSGLKVGPPVTKFESNDRAMFGRVRLNWLVPGCVTPKLGLVLETPVLVSDDRSTPAPWILQAVPVAA